MEQKVLIICKNILEENPFENFLSRSLKKTKIKTIEQKVLIICKNVYGENPFKKLSFKNPFKNKDKNH
jgi:hypothetical protein